MASAFLCDCLFYVNVIFVCLFCCCFFSTCPSTHICTNVTLSKVFLFVFHILSIHFLSELLFILHVRRSYFSVNVVMKGSILFCYHPQIYIWELCILRENKMSWQPSEMTNITDMHIHFPVRTCRGSSVCGTLCTLIHCR